MSDAPDLEHLRQWIGRERRAEDAMDPFPARGLAAVLDHRALPDVDDALPLAWHWLYFLETPRTSATGQDGHPALGDFLPPVPLPRRMWAAGTLRCLQPLALGVPAQRRSVIRGIDAKSGKSGDLMFVTVEHILTQSGRDCVIEEQNLVYRAMPAGPAPLPPGEPAADAADWTRTVHPDPALLFRYSALTYNGHRIHYDRRYAIEQEHYPALVVHGPLLATLLLDLVAEHLPDARVTGFRFRAQRPTFDDAAFRINGRKRSDEVHLWTSDNGGDVGMSAVATLA